jgi:tetratricopeptide (TPR) repeat protein
MSTTIWHAERFFAPLLLGIALPLAAHAAAGASTDSARYRNCVNASSTSPASALGDAESWAKSGGGVPAQHCAALALFNLRRYAEAGSRLDRIAGDRAVPDASFRVALFDQAGNAWLLAGEGAKAVQSLTAALALSPGDPDLYTDLARAQAMVRNWPEVVLDLDAALQMAPRRADLLVLRASAHRALKQYAQARSDIALALKLKPGDPDVLVESGLLRRQLGDVGGARRDFQAALKKAAGATAAQARENLDSLGRQP